MQQADPLAGVGLESGCLQNSNQGRMIDPIERLEPIEIDQCGSNVVFYLFYDRADHIHVALHC